MRIFALFLVLSITPFMRGCEETYGFPAPFTGGIVEPGSVQRTVAAFRAAFATAEPLIPLGADILIAILAALLVIRAVVRRPWLNYLCFSLAAHLSIVWGMLALFILDPTRPPFTDMYVVLASFSANYFYFVPGAIANSFKDDTIKAILMDGLGRAWFVMLVFVVGLALNALTALFRKIVPPRKKRPARKWRVITMKNLVIIGACALALAAAGPVAAEDGGYREVITAMSAKASALRDTAPSFSQFDRWYQDFKPLGERLVVEYSNTEKHRASYADARAAAEKLQNAWAAFKRSVDGEAMYRESITAAQDVSYALQWKESAKAAKREALESINSAVELLRKAADALPGEL